MRQVDIKDQIRLSLAKCFELCLSGIHYRLFRSLVTVSIVTLAVAFLTTMLGQSLIGRNVGVALARETAPQNDYLAWLHRLSKPVTEMDLAATLWSDPPQPNRLAELQYWGNLSADQLQALQVVARQEKRYFDYFERLTEARRALLLGSARMDESLLEGLLDAKAFGAFGQNLKLMDVPLPGTLQAFQEFLRDWEKLRPLRQAIADQQARAVAQVEQQLGGRNLVEWLAQANEADILQLDKLGFVLTGELHTLRRQAHLDWLAARMSALRNLPGLRLELANWAGVSVTDVSEQTLFEQADTLRGAQRVLEAARRERAVDLTPEQMVEASQARVRQARLTAVQAKLPPESAAPVLGFPPRTLWLILVSFGVCAVGIANAVLMSVTERFREIATMKCLGAMDGFILVLFVLESSLQGLAGGVVGAIIGLVLGLLRSWASYGNFAFSALPWSSLFACAGISMFAGIALAAAAAVYPARIASKLAPMEAMRVE